MGMVAAQDYLVSVRRPLSPPSHQDPAKNRQASFKKLRSVGPVKLPACQNGRQWASKKLWKDIA
jgi:hypothetical protein